MREPVDANVARSMLFQGPASSRVAYRDRRSLEVDVLQTLVIILVLMWLLGMVSSYTLGGFLHVLLVVALILLIVRLATGRTAV